MEIIKRKEKAIQLFIGLTVASLGLMGLDKLGWLDWLKGPAAGLTNPIRKKTHHWSVSRKKQAKDPNQLLLEEKVDSLARENAQLQAKVKELEAENEAARRLLGAPLPTDWQFSPVEVLAVKDGLMTIGLAKNSRVAKGQTVVFENVLLGRVIETNPRIGKVRLVNNRDSLIKAKVLENNAQGVVKSRAANKLILEEVLQSADLKEDQIVVTSGEQGVFPPGLLIGKIEQVEKEATAEYQEGIIKPLVDYNSLLKVFIVQDL